jgi:predicted nucleic acid-binding protein
LILLGTCIVSEPLKPRPEPKVPNWLDDQAAESLYLSTISFAELLAGVAALPAGRRRSALSEELSRVLDRLFGERLLTFDHAAAAQLPDIVTSARKRGFTISFADAQIAAIAAARGFAVATRDTGPFLATGIPVIDPWNE